MDITNFHTPLRNLSQSATSINNYSQTQTKSQLNNARLQVSLINNSLSTQTLNSSQSQIVFDSTVSITRSQKQTNYHLQFQSPHQKQNPFINHSWDNIFNSNSKSQPYSINQELNNARIQQSQSSYLKLSQASVSKKSQIFFQKFKTKRHSQNSQTNYFNFKQQLAKVKDNSSHIYRNHLFTPTKNTQQRKSTPINSQINKTLTAKIKKRGDISMENLCPICLCQFSQIKARIPCKHQFCFDCLSQWVKSSTKCPCCRGQFNKMIKLTQKIKKQKSDTNDYIQEQLRVETKQYKFNFDDYYICYVCGLGDNQHVLLLCDQCDFNSCHIYCDQRLNNIIPEGDWFCRSCCQRNPDLEQVMLQDVSHSNNVYRPGDIASSSQSEAQHSTNQSQIQSNATQINSNGIQIGRRAVNINFNRNMNRNLDNQDSQINYDNQQQPNSEQTQTLKSESQQQQQQLNANQQLPVAKRTRRNTILNYGSSNRQSNNINNSRNLSNSNRNSRDRRNNRNQTNTRNQRNLRSNSRYQLRQNRHRTRQTNFIDEIDQRRSSAMTFRRLRRRVN